MSGRVRALRTHRQDGRVVARLESVPAGSLGGGEVLIRVQYSSANYKDALAVTGRGRIQRRFPLAAGIDAAGVVAESADPRHAPGDPVLVTGYGLGQDHDGGFAEVVRVPADWVVPLPEGLSSYQAMALGTAGFTAGLAIQRMETNGQRPDLGPVAVTGAGGGVGGIAVDCLTVAGYEAVAITGRPQHAGYLTGLGARRVLDAAAIELGARPLESALWGGAIDNAGGPLLAWLCATCRLWGNVAAVGLAAGSELHTTVMPFILRGVSLLGVSSANTDAELRRRVWARLASDLRPRHLDRVVAGTCTLDELPAVLEALLERRIRGRMVVRVG